MARGLTVSVDNEVQAFEVWPILLTKIDTTGGLFRVWTGYGTLTFNGEDYLGIGDTGGVSDILETRDLQANGLTLSMSGISASKIAIALNQIQIGREASLFVGFLNSATKTLISDPYEIFTGVTDIPIINHAAETATIGLTCENKLISLNKPRTRRYTKEDQAIDDPTDEGFDFVPGLQDAVIELGQNANSEAIANLEAQ